jgi:hypothetical protein
MKRMGIEALYRRPNTSNPAPGHTIFPYLLRKLLTQAAGDAAQSGLGDGYHLYPDASMKETKSASRRA